MGVLVSETLLRDSEHPPEISSKDLGYITADGVTYGSEDWEIESKE